MVMKYGVHSVNIEIPIRTNSQQQLYMHNSAYTVHIYAEKHR